MQNKGIVEQWNKQAFFHISLQKVFALKQKLHYTYFCVKMPTGMIMCGVVTLFNAHYKMHASILTQKYVY